MTNIDPLEYAVFLHAQEDYKKLEASHDARAATLKAAKVAHKAEATPSTAYAAKQAAYAYARSASDIAHAAAKVFAAAIDCGSVGTST